jgi:HEAT repeat protein
MEPLIRDLASVLDVAGLPLYDRAFLVLALGIGFLFLLSVIFTLFIFGLRVRNNLRERRREDRVERWTRITLDVLAGDGETERLEREVSPRERIHYLEFLEGYARRIQGPEVDRLTEMAAPFIAEIVPRLDDRNLYRRAQAVQTLGRLGFDRHREEIGAALDDPAPFVAMVAAQAIIADGDRELSIRVLDRLDRFDSWSVESLTELLSGPGPKILPELRSVLPDRSRKPWVRSVAARALGELHDPQGAEVAAHLIPDESDPDLLTDLLRLLAEAGAPDHLSLARFHLTSDHDAVRGAAFRVVGSLGRKEDLPVLRAGMDDPSPWVAMKAARGMLRVGGGEILREISASEHPKASLAGQILGEMA